MSLKASPQSALQTATRDPTLPSRPCVPLLIYHIYAFFRDIYKQPETSACREDHTCLRFFRDFAGAVIPNFRSFVVFTSASFLTGSYTCSFVTFTSGRQQQHEKPARRQDYQCLWFVHDFVSAVFKTRNSCERRHFSTKGTIIL